MKRRFFGLLLLAAFLPCRRAQADSPSGQGTHLSPAHDGTPLRIADVDPSNGIDAREARAIAWAYFEGEYGDCGGPDDGVLRRQTWVFKLAFGVAGETLKETIKVNARTGGVWSAGGPRYRSLEAFRKAVSARKQAKHVGLGASSNPALNADGRLRGRGLTP